MEDCRTECNGENVCRNEDTIDLWIVRSGCTIECHLVSVLILLVQAVNLQYAFRE